MSGGVAQDLRFYPPEVVPFPHEPLRCDFAIIPAGETRGEGLVAQRPFAPGAVVFAFTGDIVPHITQYTLQIDAGCHIHDPYVMGKVLHHCAPNCHVDIATRTFTAIRPIAAGDYVTMDYCQTEDVLYKDFICSCGASECRGYISGKGLGTPGLLGSIVCEARQRLATLRPSASRYDNMVQLAAIVQVLGNELSSQLYAASMQNSGAALACRSGCSACCQVPYATPQVTTTDFTMTVLDVINLVEHRDQVAGWREIPAVTVTDKQPVLHCPQLTATGTCSIYEQRPVTCKIWFSANLDQCVQNMERGYKPGVNLFTDASDRLRTALEEPFAQWLGNLAPDLAFRGYEFLPVFRLVSMLGRNGLHRFRDRIDAGSSISAAFESATAV